MSPIELLLVFGSALAAGFTNAIAGGGTLITFPALIAAGLPTVSANITSTVALCPGYLGATFAQKKELRGQKHRLFFLLPAGAIGGIAGGILLLNTGERIFRELVPVLILLASFLLAIQDPVRKWLNKKLASKHDKPSSEKISILPVALAAVYGGYFGAGLSVIVLSCLGLTINDNLTRLNAIKQAISFSVNIAAAVFFLFSGKVFWSAAIIMAVGALTGGVIGGKLAGKVKPALLRYIVVIVGVIVSLAYWLQ